MTETVHKEMGYERAEFFRLLPLAVGGRPWQSRTGNTLEVALDTGRVIIELGTQGRRRIALLSLPILPVSLTFDNVTPAQRDQFLTRFDNSFRRGGG